MLKGDWLFQPDWRPTVAKVIREKSHLAKDQFLVVLRQVSAHDASPAVDAFLVMGLLLVAVILFASEKFAVDQVTLGLLCLLVIGGILTPQQAFAGFGSDVLVMLGAIFVIGAAMRDTGLLDQIGQVLARGGQRHPRGLVAAMMGTVGLVSAWMNNTTVTAMFLGPVISLSRRLHIPPSQLLMPLAFSSILGGTCTLIGTSTNVAVSAYLEKSGMPAVGLFETSAIGLAVFLAGLTYMLTLGKHLLPKREEGSDGAAEPIRQYLCEVKLLPHSPIVGQEVFDSDFSAMDFQVVSVRRGSEWHEPMAHLRFEAGDVVLVAGRVQNLLRVQKIEGLQIQQDHDPLTEPFDLAGSSILEVVLTPRSSLVGSSLRQSQLRQRHGLSALALLRGESHLRDSMADIPLQAGDLLLIQGQCSRLHPLMQSNEMVVLGQHETAPTNRKRAMMLLGAFAVAIALSSFGLLAPSIAFVLVAIFAVASRCISPEAAYGSVDWRLLILIGGMTAFGQAMSHSGADQWLAAGITQLFKPWGDWAVLAGFGLLTVLLTQPMSNAAAALVVLPVALRAAEDLQANPRLFAMVVMLSASISLLTPFEPSCILVYGPGKYRFSDFLKVGGGLTLLSMAIILGLAPLLWPMRS